MLLIKPLLFYLLTALLGLGLTVIAPYAESYWLLLSVLAAFYLADTQIIPQTNPSFICIGLGIALLAALSGYLVNVPLLQMSFLVVTVLITVAFGVWQPRFWRAVFVTNYLVLLAAAFGTDSIAALQRYFFVMLGFLLVAGLRWIFFHKTSARQLKWALANCLLKAASLSEAIFSVYLARDYEQRLFVYEKKLHWQRNAFLTSLVTVRESLMEFDNAKRPSFVKLLQSVEQIYEILLAIGLLVYRVSDHSTFEVANKELLALNEGLKAYLLALAAQLQRGQLAAPTTFTDSIQELQDINHDALQVVAPDPMVFILFIQDFMALNEIFAQMVEVIDEVQRA
ncbi:MAG: hypothetical protein V4501_00400 [Pseudomonadota bacterium]